MTVAMILKAKGSAVETAKADLKVLEAVRRLREKRIGAVVVVDAKGVPVGVFSERDVVRALGMDGAAALDKPVEAYMSAPVHSCRMGDTVDELMSQMTDRRIRHLPVIEDGKLIGIVSIGDVVKHRIAEAELQAQALKDYIATG
jgi:CBS domain-containing protein